MTLSFVLACLWIIAAAILAAIPSRDNHWRRAYVLSAIGIPLLGYVTWENGPWWGLIALADPPPDRAPPPEALEPVAPGEFLGPIGAPRSNRPAADWHSRAR